jgi:2,4-dienoyl-CoA reductase (NADPH2)
MIYMRQNGIMVYNDCDIQEINEEGLVVRSYDGVRWPIKCDTVVVSERGPNESLKKVVQSEGIELFVIGDALIPRNLSSAVHDGYRVGMRL